MPPDSPLPVVADWFHRAPIDDTVTLITEPRARALIRANIWHVRGRDRDLLVDSGLGIVSLRAAFPDLFSREPVLVVSHGHQDHMGSAHEFEHVWAHRLEQLESPGAGTLRGDVLVATIGLHWPPAAKPPPPLLITARPDAAYDPDRYRLRPARVTRHVEDGDIVDLGDRAFTVLHLAGHSPGSIALFDQHDGTLFAGDVVYDDVLIDEINGADRADYRRSVRRLRDLAVSVVHGGHGDSFDGARMRAIIDGYLDDERPDHDALDVVV